MLSCTLVRDHGLCGFASLAGPIPIIYLTVTPYRDLFNSHSPQTHFQIARLIAIWTFSEI